MKKQITTATHFAKTYAVAYNRSPKFFFPSLNVLHSILILVNPHLPHHLTIEKNIFHRLIFLFDACVGIGSVQMQNRPHNKGIDHAKDAARGY